MPEYEILYLISITLEPEEIKNIKQKVADIITKNDGVIIGEEELGKKKLAFAIKHARNAYYVLTAFKSEPDIVAKINHQLKLMPELIRHRLVHKKNIKLPTTADKTAPTPFKPSTQHRTTQHPATTQEKNKDTAVDIHELDRKIDELLAEHNV